MVLTFEYLQSPKGLKFKIEDKTDEQNKQAAAEDDEVKEPKEGKTYLAILTDPKHIIVLVEINPHDINEIIQSARDKAGAIRLIIYIYLSNLFLSFYIIN